MPVYTFECQECNVRFDRNMKIGEYPAHECPSCSEPAPRIIDGFSFAFAPGSSSTANSGVHDHDYPSADKMVGRDSEKKWEFMGERDKAKASAREAGGTHALQRKDSAEATDYRPMGVAVRDARRKLAREALATARANRPAKDASGR